MGLSRTVWFSEMWNGFSKLRHNSHVILFAWKIQKIWTEYNYDMMNGLHYPWQTFPDKLSLGCPSQSAQICKQASGGCVWLAVQNCWRGHAWLPGCCPAVWPAEDGRPMEYVFFWPLLAGEFLFNLRFNAIFLPTLLASLNSKRGPKPAHDPFFDPSTKTNNLS